MALGLIGGALAGAGDAGVQAGHTAQKQFGDEQLLKMKQDAERELALTLAGRREAHDASMQERREAHDVKIETDVRQPFHREERRAQFGFTRTENELNRNLQLELERMREASAERRHTESISVQRVHLGIAQEQLRLAQQQVTLFPNADGTFSKIDRSGENKGTLMRLDGLGPIQGPKDVSQSTLAMINFYSTLAKGTADELRMEVVDSEEKRVLRERLSFYEHAVRTLSGSTAPAQTFPVPTQNMIDAAKKRANDPRAKAAFEQQYGAGNWDKFVVTGGGQTDTGPAPTPAEIPREYLDKEGKYVGSAKGSGLVEIASGMLESIKRSGEEARKKGEDAQRKWLLQMAIEGRLSADPSHIDNQNARRLGVIK